MTPRPTAVVTSFPPIAGKVAASRGTPCPIQMALYTPIITGTRRATRACAERNAEATARTGKKTSVKAPTLLMRLKTTELM